MTVVGKIIVGACFSKIMIWFVENLHKINLQLNYDDQNINNGVERGEETNSPNFLLPVSVCAIAANDKSTNVWFCK